MSHFDWKLLRRKKVTPADRCGPEKEETWRLAYDHEDFDPGKDSLHPENQDPTPTPTTASSLPSDSTENPENPRYQDTRKSKTKKVKNYLRKYKSALSKDDTEKKNRTDQCTSWYLEDQEADFYHQSSKKSNENESSEAGGTQTKSKTEVTSRGITEELHSNRQNTKTLSNPQNSRKSQENVSEDNSRRISEELDPHPQNPKNNKNPRKSQENILEATNKEIIEQNSYPTNPRNPKKSSKNVLKTTSRETREELDSHPENPRNSKKSQENVLESTSKPIRVEEKDVDPRTSLNKFKTGFSGSENCQTDPKFDFDESTDVSSINILKHCATETKSEFVDSLGEFEDLKKLEEILEEGVTSFGDVGVGKGGDEAHRSRSSLYEDASDKDLTEVVLGRESGEKKDASLETLITEDSNLNKCDSNDTLIADVVSGDSLDKEEKEEGSRICTVGNRGDVATLVRGLLGPIYGDGVIDLLIRQARDILVCAYHGNLDCFLKSYLSPAAALLEEVKSVAAELGNESVVPEGWPLTLAKRGLILQLGELETSSLRLGECYLCVRAASGHDSDSAPTKIEIAVVWRATSMRAPRFLGWDREEEFMDWRQVSQKLSPAPSTSEPSRSMRPRRRSREYVRKSSLTDQNHHHHHHRVNREETRSIDRLEWKTDQPDAGHAVTKSRSTSSVGNWEENDSSPSNNETRVNVNRCAKVVLSSTMEKWKETNRYETKSKSLKPEDLKTPSRLEEALDNKKDLEDRLNNLRHVDDVNDEELPAFIGNLLVSVERKIERVSLDNFTFPCPACRNIDTDDPLLACKCAGDEDNDLVKDEGRSFEIAGIKHIDSDDEEEVRMGFGTKRRDEVAAAARSIHDLPERVLVCGLTLPGCVDVDGRPVLDFLDDGARREGLTAKDVASFLLYLTRLPSSESVRNGYTILIRSLTYDGVEFVDGVLNLVQGRVDVFQALVLKSDDSNEDQLIQRHVKTITVDEKGLKDYIPTYQQHIYDHSQWIAFYKEYDCLMTEWQAAGRRLALEMSELKESGSLSSALTPLGRLLTDPNLRRTSRDAEDAISVLEERAAPLFHLDYIKLSVKRARRLVEEVSKAAARLESSFESRRATIRNLAVLRSIEDQAHEVLSWFCKKGEDVLSKHGQLTATNLSTARLHEREFEKFYFTSMRHLDKGSDLAEAASASGLRELARSLKHHLRGFGSRLEDKREYLEDTSRCCLLQDRAYEWAQEARLAGERGAQQFLMARPPLPPEHFAEMMTLAEKLGNEILLEQCSIARSKCMEALELARGGSDAGSPRRRSYAASSDATSWEDTLAKRTSWDDSDSTASYACPMDSVGSSKQVLDNIAELRESAEQLLDCSPPRSPAPRRSMLKPPVNSHLHRSASIAPGMKAKKTILLIMREMIQTERDYVKSLEYIIENYIPELVREDIPQALRGQRNVIFGNVEKIYEFHSQHFLRELEQCEQSPMNVGQCFLRHEKKFYLYALYNKNKPNSDSLMAEYGTTFFKQKQLELGDKMDLASYLLKPVQRMGKYALLLQQLVKAGTDLSEQMSGDGKDEKDDGMKPMVEGEADLRSAEQMVRFQLRHGNDLLAMDSLRDCDVNVKEQGRLLRQNEFLVWQGKGKKCLRQVFLFEDLILFSKARRFPDRKNLDIYIYKHSIKTTDIGLTAVIADSPTKFEIWFRKRKPGDTYTLQCASEEIKRAWTEELSNLLWKQALRNREVRLAEMSSMGIGNKPCLDIRPSADQINDRSISVAQLSKTPRFRNSIAVSTSDDSTRCSRRPHSVISVSSSSSSGGSSGPPTTLNLGLDTSPRPHHRSTTLNSQCSVESGIIADISIVSDDGGEGTERSHWNSNLESPTTTSTPLQSPTTATATASSSENNLSPPYDQDMSINL
ncbi:uncharacterized protein LOC108629330 isoform X2 [Ceratina calcarata]|uniref:Uncharacterized protein LOC108629330 isoform X2 n=1 Tax=Ceratina calcarata TaxID=156304 RepID=A0AAJ7NBS0_9HYME|nr:uncharacterized protein LOC108629330 isoform X2 [Ceratina calcarata]XP_017887418.1 uncharacterized protein LOC108629330 isoform X2 [Ceratina calcarata]